VIERSVLIRNVPVPWRRVRISNVPDYGPASILQEMEPIIEPRVLATGSIRRSAVPRHCSHKAEFLSAAFKIP
jgi:hypothetical protein